MTGELGRGNRRVYEDQLGQVAQSERMDMATSLPARVKSIENHPEKGLIATMEVLYKPVFNGQQVDFPDLLEVPVDVPRGGGFVAGIPVKAGDYGTIHFASRDSDDYQMSGDAMAPPSARYNSFSDGRFTPGAGPAPKAMSDYDMANAFFGTDDHKNGVRVSPAGTVAIEGAGESLMAILSELLETLVAEDLSIAYGSSAGTGHALHFRPKYASLLGRLNTMKLR